MMSMETIYDISLTDKEIGVLRKRHSEGGTWAELELIELIPFIEKMGGGWGIITEPDGCQKVIILKRNMNPTVWEKILERGARRK